MIEIVTTAEVSKKGKKVNVHVTCNIKTMKGERCVLVSELATIIKAIDDEFPGMIGEALQLNIEEARRRT